MRRRSSRYTVGRNVPRGNRKACLCPDNTYSRKCCNGYLLNHGIGLISSVAGDLISSVGGEFNNDFSNDFKI